MIQARSQPVLPASIGGAAIGDPTGSRGAGRAPGTPGIYRRACLLPWLLVGGIAWLR